MACPRATTQWPDNIPTPDILDLEWYNKCTLVSLNRAGPR